jgi:hypothetical protein
MLSLINYLTTVTELKIINPVGMLVISLTNDINFKFITKLNLQPHLASIRSRPPSWDLFERLRTNDLSPSRELLIYTNIC